LRQEEDEGKLSWMADEKVELEKKRKEKKRKEKSDPSNAES